MKVNNTETPLSTEELDLLENDTVWSVLDKAPAQDASPAAQPMFARNVMREIRQMDQINEATQPWWKAVFSSNLAKVLVPAGAVAACVAVFADFSSPAASTHLAQNDEPIEDVIFTFEDITEFSATEATAQTDTEVDELDAFALEMLAIENEDPIFMSADEIDALVSN